MWFFRTLMGWAETIDWTINEAMSKKLLLELMLILHAMTIAMNWFLVSLTQSLWHPLFFFSTSHQVISKKKTQGQGPINTMLQVKLLFTFSNVSCSNVIAALVKYIVFALFCKVAEKTSLVILLSSWASSLEQETSDVKCLKIKGDLHSKQ